MVVSHSGSAARLERKGEKTVKLRQVGKKFRRGPLLVRFFVFAKMVKYDVLRW